MSMEEDIKKMRAALKPFAAAYDRLRSYDESEPPDDAPLMAEHDHCSFELLDGEEGPAVTVGDLRNVRDALNDVDLWAS